MSSRSGKGTGEPVIISFTTLFPPDLSRLDSAVKRNCQNFLFARICLQVPEPSSEDGQVFCPFLSTFLS